MTSWETAKRPKLGPSRARTTVLAQTIRGRKAREWQKRNRAALHAYNEHVEKHGVFGEGLRSF